MSKYQVNAFNKVFQKNYKNVQINKFAYFSFK